MTMFDVKFADVYVETTFGGKFNLWRNGEPFATVDALGLTLVVAGARQMNVAVYDVDTGVYLVKTF